MSARTDYEFAGMMGSGPMLYPQAGHHLQWIPTKLDDPEKLMDLIERCAKFKTEHSIDLGAEIALLRERLQQLLKMPAGPEDGAVTFRKARMHRGV